MSAELSKLKIAIINESGERSEFVAELAKNTATKELLEHLKSGALNLKMVDYQKFEKYAKLPFRLPQSDEKINTACGDIMLAWGDTLAIYYDKNSYNFTPLGKILGECKQLKTALGSGDIQAEFSSF